MVEDIRIRHSHGKHRATLVTVRNGEMIYFGIARCNHVAGDVFVKSLGRHIAKERALKDLEDNSVYGLPIPTDGLYLHDSGLRGHCKLTNIKELLLYFEEINKVPFKPQYNTIVNRWEKMAGVDKVDESCCYGEVDDADWIDHQTRLAGLR